jgi:thioredoxin-related protein
MEFDKDRFINNKKLQKVTAEYFQNSGKWRDMDYEQSQAEQAAFFKKYGMTADDFYKGELAKYDSDHAKKVKGLKEEAAGKNKSLFEEYAKQPTGTRNIWASDKLEQLVSQGYFDDNPFLKSFKWINKDTIQKSHKQKAVKHALATGDWSGYRKLVGTSAKALAYQKAKSSGDWSGYRKQFGTTPKAAARDKAVATGDWTEYKKQFGTAKTAFEHDGKYFKSRESMESYKEGTFWRRYALASKEDRRKLLAENPAYNKRANWTEAQWDAWKIEDKKKKLAALKGHKTGGKSFTNYLLLNEEKALRFTSAQTSKHKYKKIAYA